MLNAKQTELVMEKFFNDCLRFWTREGKDEREAFVNALNDVRSLKTDPFSPCGEPLNMNAQQKFVHYREMDLGVSK